MPTSLPSRIFRHSYGHARGSASSTPLNTVQMANDWTGSSAYAAAAKVGRYRLAAAAS